MNSEEARKLAILIDAENISHRYARLILDEADRFGSVICKRIYADWSSPSSLSWKKAVMDYSIQPIQQFSNASGKNSSDSALIIDAMDLLHEGKLQGFCIVSSDSDFTRLAARLRESEMLVVGMGEQKTPASFMSACDKFLYLDVLLNEKAGLPSRGAGGSTQSPAKNPAAEPDYDSAVKSGMDRDEIIKAINELISENSDEDDWMFLGLLGNRLLSKFPDFDPRNFGFSKMTPFVESLNLYEFKSEANPSTPTTKRVYIRKKK